MPSGAVHPNTRLGHSIATRQWPVWVKIRKARNEHMFSALVPLPHMGRGDHRGDGRRKDRQTGLKSTWPHMSGLGRDASAHTRRRSQRHQRGHTEIYRGAEYAVSFIPKVMVEVAVPASLVERVIDAIMKSACTGQIGDGKIFVAGIDRAVRIRTGETDHAAL